MRKKYKELVHICVCIPNMGSWRNETAKSMALMFAHFSRYGVPGVKHSKITLLTAEGSMLSQLREILVRKVLQQSDATHLLFIDSDMQFPMTMARDLVLRGKGFVAANCTTRVAPPIFVAHDADGKRLDSRGKTGLQEVQHVGLAVAMIETEALKKLRPPMFLMDWVPEQQAYCGEDVYFSQLLTKYAGEVLYVDHDLSQHIGHVGSYVYGPRNVTTNEEQG